MEQSQTDEKELETIESAFNYVLIRDWIKYETLKYNCKLFTNDESFVVKKKPSSSKWIKISLSNKGNVVESDIAYEEIIQTLNKHLSNRVDNYIRITWEIVSQGQCKSFEKTLTFFDTWIIRNVECLVSSFCDREHFNKIFSFGSLLGKSVFLMENSSMKQKILIEEHRKCEYLYNRLKALQGKFIQEYNEYICISYPSPIQLARLNQISTLLYTNFGKLDCYCKILSNSLTKEQNVNNTKKQDDVSIFGKIINRVKSFSKKFVTRIQNEQEETDVHFI